MAFPTSFFKEIEIFKKLHLALFCHSLRNTSILKFTNEADVIRVKLLKFAHFALTLDHAFRHASSLISDNLTK